MDSNISTITLAGVYIIRSKPTWLTNNNKHTRQHISKYSQSLVLCQFFQEIHWNRMPSKEEISCAKWFTSICTTGFTWHPRHDNSSIQSVHGNVEKIEERPNVWQLKDHLPILYSYIQRIMSHVLASRHLLICWSQAPHIQLLRFSSCWVADTLVMICPEVCDLCTLRWIVGGSLAPGEGVDNGIDL